MFRFGVFQRRLISDEGISVTIADACTSERYVGKGEHCDGWVHLFFTGFISRFCVFAANDEKALSLGGDPLICRIKLVLEQLIWTALKNY